MKWLAKNFRQYQTVRVVLCLLPLALNLSYDPQVFIDSGLFPPRLSHGLPGFSDLVWSSRWSGILSWTVIVSAPVALGVVLLVCWEVMREKQPMSRWIYFGILANGFLTVFWACVVISLWVNPISDMGLEI